MIENPIVSRDSQWNATISMRMSQEYQILETFLLITFWSTQSLKLLEAGRLSGRRKETFIYRNRERTHGNHFL